MDINIKPLLSGEARKLAFDYELPVEHEESGYVLAKNARVQGEIKDMGGYMQLDAECVIGYETECARCLKKIDGECSIRFVRPVAVKLEKDNEEEALTKEARIYNGLKTISLTSGAGKTGQPLVKE